MQKETIHHMGVRVFNRIPVHIAVTINNGTDSCDGTLMNLSEKGMFIRTNSFPCQINSDLEVTIPMRDDAIQITGKLIRVEDIRGYYKGIGISVPNPPQEYLDFLDSLVAVL